MEKLLFTVLVAIVAVGGALANNSNKKFLIQGGEFNTSAPCRLVTVDCTPNYTDDLCTAILLGVQIQVYKESTITSKCLAILYKSN